MVVRVGFIGCGLIAKAHRRNLSFVSDAAIVAVYDIDSERANIFAADPEVGGTASVLGSAQEVIDAVDAVYVTTWTSEHPALVTSIAAAGKAVFCEKPLGIDLATARSMFDEVQAAGVVNQVGLVLRHSPAFRVMHHHLRAAGHGSRMSMMFRDDQFIPIQGGYASTWRADVTKAGAGTLLEHSIHDLDLIDWMMGPIVKVSCSTANFHGFEGIEDQAAVLLTAADGATALLSSTWHDIMSRPSMRLVEGFCREAMVCVVGDWNGPLTIHRSDGAPIVLEGEALHSLADELSGGMNPDADFIDAVMGSHAAAPDFGVALRAHVLADAAYRSAASGGLPIDV